MDNFPFSASVDGDRSRLGERPAQECLPDDPSWYITD
jgi:hypothetical protein